MRSRLMLQISTVKKSRSMFTSIECQDDINKSLNHAQNIEYTLRFTLSTLFG